MVEHTVICTVADIRDNDWSILLQLLKCSKDWSHQRLFMYNEDQICDAWIRQQQKISRKFWTCKLQGAGIMQSQTPRTWAKVGYFSVEWNGWMHDVVAACRESAVREPATHADTIISSADLYGEYFLIVALCDSWNFFCFSLMVFCGGNNGLSALDQQFDNGLM